jgi:ribonuclease J
VLDVGRPLNAERGEVIPLPDIAGFGYDDPTLVGVVISHAHQDHWGLADQIPNGVPIFMGAATSRILAEAAFWTEGLVVAPAGYLEHRQPFELGPFRITPFLNDHSAFDAYSILVEADGTKLFYSGDIRGHGRKASIFEQLVRDPPTDVDVLLMEGTNIRPGGAGGEAQMSETDVELAIAATMRATSGMTLVMSSAQNIDRLVTIYRAALQSGRELVMDLYGASIVRATQNVNIPQPGPDWPRVHVYVPMWQRVKVKTARAFNRVEEVKDYRIYEEYLAENRSKLVMMFSMNSASALDKAGALEGSSCIWSLWNGYLTEPSGVRLTRFLEDHKIPFVQQHTSGHASIGDLQRLATAIGARRLVPIHSFGPEQFTDLFDNVTQEDDGAWWEV